MNLKRCGRMINSKSLLHDGVPYDANLYQLFYSIPHLKPSLRKNFNEIFWHSLKKLLRVKFIIDGIYWLSIVFFRTTSQVIFLTQKKIMKYFLLLPVVVILHFVISSQEKWEALSSILNGMEIINTKDWMIKSNGSLKYGIWSWSNKRTFFSTAPHDE